MPNAEALKKREIQDCFSLSWHHAASLLHLRKKVVQVTDFCTFKKKKNWASSRNLYFLCMAINYFEVRKKSYSALPCRTLKTSLFNMCINFYYSEITFTLKSLKLLKRRYWSILKLYFLGNSLKFKFALRSDEHFLQEHVQKHPRIWYVYICVDVRLWMDMYMLQHPRYWSNSIGKRK